MTFINLLFQFFGAEVVVDDDVVAAAAFAIYLDLSIYHHFCCYVFFGLSNVEFLVVSPPPFIHVSHVCSCACAYDMKFVKIYNKSLRFLLVRSKEISMKYQFIIHHSVYHEKAAMARIKVDQFGAFNHRNEVLTSHSGPRRIKTSTLFAK